MPGCSNSFTISLIKLYLCSFHINMLKVFNILKGCILILMSHYSNSTWLFMHINLQLQTSDFVDVDLAGDHCHGSSKSPKTHLWCNPTYGLPLRGVRLAGALGRVVMDFWRGLYCIQWLPTKPSWLKLDLPARSFTESLIKLYLCSFHINMLKVFNILKGCILILCNVKLNRY